MRWTEITIDAEPGAVDAIQEALRSAGCDGVVVRDTATPPNVSGYLPVDDRLESRLDSLQTALTQFPSFGVEGAGMELILRNVQESDWANAWKAFYKSIRVGRHFVVTPPWETPELGDGDIPLVIDPGMAFGTGSHPTTQLCLTALEDYLQQGSHVADIGTGSGILAIAASKAGAASVIATDIDPLAVKIAAENIAANHVSAQTQQELPSRKFDFAVANILADVIIGLSEQLAALVKPGGILVVSGIIDTRESDVRSHLVDMGFETIETRRDAEWVALILRRNAP